MPERELGGLSGSTTCRCVRLVIALGAPNAAWKCLFPVCRGVYVSRSAHLSGRGFLRGASQAGTSSARE